MCLSFTFSPNNQSAGLLYSQSKESSLLSSDGDAETTGSVGFLFSPANGGGCDAFGGKDIFGSCSFDFSSGSFFAGDSTETAGSIASAGAETAGSVAFAGAGAGASCASGDGGGFVC